MSVKCILQGQEAWRIPMKMVSNPNLLLNWDFRKPVNRNGKEEYNTAQVVERTIDRWCIGWNANISVTSSGLQATEGTEIFQEIDQNLADYLTDKTVYLSVLTNIGFYFRTGKFNELQNTVNNLTISINSPAHGTSFIFKAPQNETIIAAKLELGDHQTLARQNESGEWEIIDPIDYDTQYLLCSQYSPITGEWVGSQHSNKNLLDNWYFVGGGSQLGEGKFPINQKNITNVSSGTAKIYFIDRWMTARGDIEVTTNGLSILCGSEMNNCFVQQIVPLPELSGKQVTVSALIDSELYAYTAIIPTEYAQRVISPITDGIQLAITKMTNSFAVDIYVMPSSVPRLVIAAKLELGPVSTLAHKEGDTWVLNDPPPDYALELAKCQRYYNQSWTGEMSAIQLMNAIAITPFRLAPAIQFPVEMRITPTIKIWGSDLIEGHVNNWENGEAVTGIKAVYINEKHFIIGKNEDATEGNFEVGKAYEFLYSADSNL